MVVREIQERVTATRQNLQNPQETLMRLHEPANPPSNAQRKMFEYACRILGGQRREEVTRGLPKNWVVAIEDYIGNITRLPPGPPKQP